jgi:hypothetical protein
MVQLTPMVEQVEARYGQSPQEWLVDGGYPAHEPLDQAAEHTMVFSPVPKSQDPEADPHAPKQGDSTAVEDWRKRMGTEEAKTIYGSGKTRLRWWWRNRIVHNL